MVLGASGFVGSACVRELESCGEDVIAAAAPRLDSSASGAADILREAQALAGLTGELAAPMQAVDVVVNAAGLATPSGADSPRLTGANALLPSVLRRAAETAGVRRFIHLSSAAVQGHSPVLDETDGYAPFSPYSRSKALGEAALRLAAASGEGRTATTIIRATSVQGPDRPTTLKLVRLARSPLASVAAPGTAPTPVTSLASLTALVHGIGAYEGDIPPVVLQPWEGMTVSSVLEAAGGRRPVQLPAAVCRSLLAAGGLASRAAGNRLQGGLRRVELMWFGQRQVDGWAQRAGLTLPAAISEVLRQAAADRTR
jgi:dTDP-4-dehydrorhamnose reductase